MIQGCVLDLGFNEGVGTGSYDRTLNKNHGTIFGATWTGGKYGKALSFNGTTSYVVAPRINLGTGDFTVALWVKPSSVGSIFQSLIGNKWQGFTVSQSGWACMLNNSGRPRFITSDGTTQRDLTGTGADLRGAGWNLIHYIRTPTQLLIYVKGVFSNSLDAGTVNVTKVRSTYIGNNVVDAYPYKGLIDESQIYTRALSFGEIRSLYNYNRHHRL